MHTLDAHTRRTQDTVLSIRRTQDTVLSIRLYIGLYSRIDSTVSCVLLLIYLVLYSASSTENSLALLPVWAVSEHRMVTRCKIVVVIIIEGECTLNSTRVHGVRAYHDPVDIVDNGAAKRKVAEAGDNSAVVLFTAAGKGGEQRVRHLLTDKAQTSSVHSVLHSPCRARHQACIVDGALAHCGARE
jgi:hypothetical protein